jgi:hypothetical protein
MRPVLKRATLSILFLFFVTPLFAQDPANEANNPLLELRDEVKKVLSDAGVPFTEQQEKSIALMMEDRRQASEDLFGQLMDFRSGPVQGQQQDRAVAAIQWMHSEFKKRLSGFLTADQSAVWTRHEKDVSAGQPAAAPAQQQQTQLIRINNNNFTAEGPCYACAGERTEVIQKGGIGAFHGNASFDFKDEALNARNPFATNRPPYQQRNTNVSVNGPFIRNKLTANASFFNSLQENADTVYAETLDGIFERGFSRPFSERNLFGGGTYQLTEAHSLIFNGGFGRWTSRNQGIGGRNLPERASTAHGRYSNFTIRQFSVISPQTLYETKFGYYRNHDDTTPTVSAIQINVLGAFNGGGAQNHNEGNRRNYSLSNLYTHMGQRVTTKAGFDAFYLHNVSLSENNFLGAYTFSNLDDFKARKAASFSVTRGNPNVDFSMLQWSLFLQNDIKLTQRLTAMLGVRYESQNKLHDRNNIGPRVGFAFAMNRSTVIRGGTGIFYQRLWDWIYQNQLRGDGRRQYDIVIDEPFYDPANLDPFQSGSVTVPPASIRVTDRELAAPYEVFSSISIEKTFFKNLFISAKYDHSRGVHQYRNRDMNAPLPGETEKPDSTRGNIWNLESTAFFRNHNIGLNLRERFSIFNITANYNYYRFLSDADGPFGSPSNNYNLRADWGRSGTPIHQVNSTVNAKLFWGFFLTETTNLNSGNRYNITTGDDDNNDGVFNDRPQGERRNAGDGPRFVNFNFNVSKAFFIGEKPDSKTGSGGSQQNVNFYANMTNAFNRTNYGTPSGVKSSPSTFGRSYNAKPAREIQIGLRYQF